MRSRVLVLAALAAVLGAGCAARRGWVEPRSARPAGAGPRGARADFAPGRSEDILATAVDLLRARGLEIAGCDADLGRLVTAPVEVDAPCWGTTCLARETTSVKLGHRRARVTLTREVWDPTLRAWKALDDPATVEALAREERELVVRMVAPPSPPRDEEPQPARRDPCGGGACRDASCVASSVPLAAAR